MWKLYFWLREGIVGVFRNFLFNIFTTALAFVSFLVLALWLVLMVNVQFASDQVESNVKIVVNLEDSVTDYQGVAERIEGMDGVTDYSFTTKDEAYEIMRETLDDREDMLTTLGFNPLPASFSIQVDDPNEIRLIASKIETWGIHRSIQYGENYVDKLVETMDYLENIFLGILLVMIISSGSMVYVSIRMNILNRNKELEIKHLVGAGMWNIKIPFLIEGMILTSVAAGFALLFVFFGYNHLVEYLTGIYPGTKLAPLNEIMTTALPVLIITALIVGSIGSFLSTQKYLKRH